jgi:hypothetical protein
VYGMDVARPVCVVLGAWWVREYCIVRCVTVGGALMSAFRLHRSGTVAHFSNTFEPGIKWSS